ncbi:hypothetical protein EON81_16320 [bacterium]|nr:MAG: hypothetical protein EON81_16320 [bacterium]
MLSAVFLGFLTQTPTAPIADNPEVLAWSEKIVALTKAPEPDWSKVTAELNHSRAFIHEEIAADRLKTAADFQRASRLVDDSRGWFENRMLQHELSLCAFLLGAKEGNPSFRQSWDGLMGALGRKQRFGFFSRPKPGTKKFAPYNVDPNRPSAMVLLYFTKPQEAIARAKAARDSVEMEAIRKVDQDDRQTDWKPEEIEGIMARDAKRLARTKELLKQGRLVTARDLHNASLLLQHSDSADDYAAAHELAVAAFLLGDGEARWLISRTYDRFLLQLGHRQRLGTQYWPGTVEGLGPMDDKWMNDTIRTTLGAATLEKTREIAKQYATGG